MRKFTKETPENCKKAVLAVIEEFLSLPAMSVSELDPEKTLLVIVDVVNGFVREGAMASPLVEDIIPPIVSLMEKCQDKKIPSVAFADCHGEDCAEFSSFPPHCIKNTSESEIVEEIKKTGGYTLIEKNSTNGFHESSFINYLDGKSGIDTFIVTGDCTDICVMQFCLTLKTKYTAQNKNVEIIIPVNCVETYDAPWHDADFTNIAAYKLMKDSGIKFVSDITD